MGLPPIFGSSFEFLLHQSQSSSLVVIDLILHTLALFRSSQALNQSTSQPSAPMAMATRGSKASKNPIGKASNRSTAASRTNSAFNSARRGVPDPPSDHDKLIPATSSSGTMSPDIIEETDIETLGVQKVMKQLIQNELAKKSDGQRSIVLGDTHRVHKSQSRRRHRRHYLSGSSTDSEEGDRPRVSFLHHDQGTRPFIDLAARFPTILMKNFKQIFFGTFQPENLTKLGQRMSDRATSEAPQKVKGLGHLLLCLEIYGQIVLHFAKDSRLGPLQQSFSEYRVRLIEMSVIYKFDSVREYNETFMRTRILLGQDDPVAWALEDRRCFDRLVPKVGPH